MFVKRHIQCWQSSRSRILKNQRPTSHNGATDSPATFLPRIRMLPFFKTITWGFIISFPSHRQALRQRSVSSWVPAPGSGRSRVRKRLVWNVQSGLVSLWGKESWSRSWTAGPALALTLHDHCGSLEPGPPGTHVPEMPGRPGPVRSLPGAPHVKLNFKQLNTAAGAPGGSVG